MKPLASLLLIITTTTAPVPLLSAQVITAHTAVSIHSPEMTVWHLGASNLTLTPSSTAVGPNQQVIITASTPVAWSLGTGSAGTLVTVDTQHAIYTAPNSIPIISPMGGCGSYPNDSVYNTPITNLPVHALSAQWLSPVLATGILAEPSFSYNLVTTPDFPTLGMNYFYGGSTPNVPLLSWPNKKRENSWDASAWDESDHHSLTITTGANACHFYELYNDVISPSDTVQCQNGSGGCNATSGDDYTPNSYDLVAATDAAGLPQYLTLRLDEIKNNAIHHPTRFTLARGYIQSAASGTPNLWPATGNNGWGSVNSLPFGARLRLKPNFDVSAKSQYAQNILNSFKQYGLMLADTGTNGAIQTGTDVWEDPSVAAAVYEAISGLTFANFDVVDESSLMVNLQSVQVNPNNPYVVPSGTAQILAQELSTTGGQNSNAVLDLGLVGIGVGLRNPQVSALIIGSPYSYDFGNDAWVTGTTNQNLTWTLVSGPGSVTSYGVYSFPTSVSTVTPVVLTAASAADPNSTATQYILLYPVSSDGNFRAALGGQFIDGNSNTWWNMPGMEGGILIQSGGDYPNWASLSGNPEQAIYQSGAYANNSDLHWQLIVPNTNYKVRFLFGQPYDGCGVCVITPSLHAPVAIGVNGQLDAHWYLWGQQVNNQVATPWDYFAPGQVTNNVLDIWMSRVNPDFDTYSTYPGASGVEIMPDTSAPHISIDTGMESWTPGGAAITTQPLVVAPGTTQQLYAVGWYMSNAVTWTVVSGPGSIDPITGLYTAPSSAPSMAQSVIVEAISTVDDTQTATATLTIL